MTKDIAQRSGKVKSKELQLPTTAPPKAAAGTRGDGMIYYNMSDNKIYVCAGGTWRKTAALS